MGPVHVTPDGCAGVALEEYMVLTAKKSRCTGIVHPVGLRQQMKLRSQGIAPEPFPEHRRKLFFCRCCGLLQRNGESGAGSGMHSAECGCSR